MTKKNKHYTMNQVYDITVNDNSNHEKNMKYIKSINLLNQITKKYPVDKFKLIDLFNKFDQTTYNLPGILQYYNKNNTSSRNLMNKSDMEIVLELDLMRQCYQKWINSVMKLIQINNMPMTKKSINDCVIFIKKETYNYFHDKFNIMKYDEIAFRLIWNDINFK